MADIVRDGILVGFETSRDTARTIGRDDERLRARAKLAARADDSHVQSQCCCQATVPFEALFDDVDHGIYMESNRSWSIDDHRLNFQFGCQIGWEIVRGKRTRMLKNPTYAGVTPQFWGSCDAIADRAFLDRMGHAELRQGRADADVAAPRRRLRRRAFATCRSVSATLDEAAREDIAARVLTYAGGQSEAIVSDAELGLTRFTHNAIHQNLAERDTSVRLRTIVEARTGVATTNDLSDAGLRALVDASQYAGGPRASRRRDSPPYGRARGSRRPPARSTAKLAAATPEQRARLAADVFAVAEAAGRLGGRLCDDASVRRQPSPIRAVRSLRTKGRRAASTSRPTAAIRPAMPSFSVMRSTASMPSALRRSPSTRRAPDPGLAPLRPERGPSFWNRRRSASCSHT